MIVEGYKIQALEGKLERKKGEDGERDGALRLAAERTMGMRGMAGGAQGSGELDKVATTSRRTIRENSEDNYRDNYGDNNGNNNGNNYEE